MFYIVLALISGVMVSVQSSCNGVLSPFIGVFGVGFISMLLNAFTCFLLEFIPTRTFPKPGAMPPRVYLGSICAASVMGFSGYLVARVGSAVTVCLSVSGQLIMSAIVDHFGWFGSEKVRFRSNRILGFFCILAGVFVINFAGADSFRGIAGQGMLLFLLLFAVFLGFITVLARMFNFEASHYVGPIAGGFYIAGVGALLSFVLLLCTSGFQIPVSGFAKAPFLAYLTGPLGGGACLLNNLTYGKMKVFHATIFNLVGQIGASIVADLILLGEFPLSKLVGILVVCAGIFLDKRATLKAQKQQ
ncbi:MAG: DMT family transporter [Lachnospiraceae bacterium]|nr:DMT family transporter [Lachnospiraceae bacterium]